MYKLCKTEQSARRQRELEIGLLRAMVSKHYEDINVSDLCLQLNIPRKSFYRYFSGKDGALHALIDHTLMEYERFNKAMYSTQPRTLYADLDRFFRFWKEQAPLLNALSKSGLSGVLIERALAYFQSEIAFPKRFFLGETTESQYHVVRFSVCGLLTMVLFWHAGGYQEPTTALASTAVRLLTRPLFPDAAILP